MTYVVTDSCVNCKYTECVDICPMDCFHEGPNMLVINPSKCIDCGLCAEECPTLAITHEHTEEAKPFKALNQMLSREWPNIYIKKKPMTQAEELKNVIGKISAINLFR